MARHRSAITLPGYGLGRPSKNKGKTFRAGILTHEEIVAMTEMCNAATQA